MNKIHPSAIIDKKANIDDNVQIGPFCVIGENVTLKSGVRLLSHVSIEGYTEIGEDTIVYPFASLGHRPQDLKFRGEISYLTIGKRNQIRENVTMNPGTQGGGLLTSVGDDCLFMVGVHIAHDCKVGNGVVFANCATLAGHVSVGDFAVLGGLSAVHQFVRIGQYAMIGGMTGVVDDVIPYGTVTGNRAHLSGLNLIGLKRRSISREEIHALRHAYRLLFSQKGTLAERVEQVQSQFNHYESVMDIIHFIRIDNSRSICQPKMENE